MAKTTDSELVEKLFTATQEGKVDWKPTARRSQFTASFGGKWTILTEAYQAESGDDRHDLEMRNSEGKLLLRLTNLDDARISELHELARRRALKVDDAIVDLMGELDKLQP